MTEEPILGEEVILKKKGVQLVKKRLKEWLKPLGFRPYPHSTICFVRERETFVDEVWMDTSGYHLKLFYRIYARYAPFARLECDQGRLWRTAQREISTYLFWACELTPNCVGFYFTDHLEAVWRDVVHVLERFVLPQMEAMTEEGFCDRLRTVHREDTDFFKAETALCWVTREDDPRGGPEAAVCGVELWRMGRVEEAIPYLTMAQEKYQTWIDGWEERGEDRTDPRYEVKSKTLALLEELLALWNGQEEGWREQAQERVEQVAVAWMDYVY